MKKFFLVLVGLLVITGCGEKEKEIEEKKEETGVITCTNNSKNVASGYEVSAEYKINYKGNIVESVETIEIVTSKSEDILEYFEESLNSNYKKMDNVYGGYTYNITRSNNSITSKVKIDYNKMDLEQFIEDQPTLKNYSKNNKLLVTGIQSMYESMGATCK